MNQYSYKVADSVGKIKNNIIKAKSKEQAKEFLIANGYLLIELKEITNNKQQKNQEERRNINTKNNSNYENYVKNRLSKDKNAKSFIALLKKLGAIEITPIKLKTDDLIAITRQLGSLVNAGISLNHGLKILIAENQVKQQKKILSKVLSFLEEGYSLSKALSMCDNNIPDEYIASIAVAEESGSLGKVLNSLANSIEKSHNFAKSVKSALIYPSIMIATSILVLGFLMVYIVPKMTVIFETSKQELPQITQFVLQISHFFQNYWQIIAIAIIVIILVIYFGQRNYRFKYKLHTYLLHVPQIGNFIRVLSVAHWAQNLALLVKSGVSIIDAINIASQVVNNANLKSKIETMATKVRDGDSLSLAMKEAKFFPYLATNLVASGEDSGNLDKMLRQVAKNYATEIENKTKVILSLTEPVLILAMGGVVMVVVLAVMLPILEINQMVG